MAILKIARMGHPVLLQRAEPVADPTAPEIRRLVADIGEVDERAAAGLRDLACHTLRLLPRRESIDEDRSALARQGQRRCPADTARAPGDDRCLAFKGSFLQQAKPPRQPSLSARSRSPCRLSESGIGVGAQMTTECP